MSRPTVAVERNSEVIDPANPDRSRLVAIDLLRGLALTMVLVDHIERLVAHAHFFQNWTLIGLGFSDAADTFMFLSGFSLGWVDARRMDRQGFWCCQRKALGRTIRIYGSYLATTLAVSLLAWSLSQTSLAYALPLTVTDASMFWKTLRDAAGLFDCPVGVLSILCVYTIVLPFLPGILWLARWHWAIPMAFSSSLYLAAQVDPRLNPGDLYFNPLAWQWLIVFGLVCGQRARHGDPLGAYGKLGLITAVLVLAYGLATQKEIPLFGLGPLRVPFEGDLGTNRWLVSKTSLGPLRVLHFLALAIVAHQMLRERQSFSNVWRPFILCGRHSLTLYCLGVVLTYLAGCAAILLPGSRWTLLFLGLDACLLQFAAAWILEWWLEPRVARRSATHQDRQSSDYSAT